MKLSTARMYEWGGRPGLELPLESGLICSHTHWLLPSKLKTHSGIDVDGFFLALMLQIVLFDSVLKHIVCLGENKPTFNYLRCVANKNYKSVTLPHKTVQ